MIRAFLCMLGCVAFAQTAYGQSSGVMNISHQRERLEQRLEDLLQQDLALTGDDPSQIKLFLPTPTFEAADAEQQRLIQHFARRCAGLAGEALKLQDGALAYQLLHEAAFFGNDVAQKIVGVGSANPQVMFGRSPHPRLRWKSRTYYRVTTDHFQVVARNQEQGIVIAKRLEALHTIWRQIFFDCWTSHARLTASMKQLRPLIAPKRMGRLHRVVLFGSRQEYIDYLRPRHPQIEISLGYYDMEDRTSYFFSGSDSTISTQLHEVCHQLFQELSNTPQRHELRDNFWVLEGVAMYMESMRQHSLFVTVGGYHANRLQYARYRCLQEGFYLPLEQLCELGRSALQTHPQIRRIYSQSAGVTHYLMRSHYRRNFVNYIKSVYGGRSDANSLAAITGRSFDKLDQEYRDSLVTTDNEIMYTVVAADSLRALNLGGTRITGARLKTIPRQSKLSWLDLTATAVDDSDLTFLAETSSLTQVSFDGTSITDATVARLTSHSQIDELDLSNTKITDAAGQHLANLTRLRTLWLSNTSVSDEGMEPLLGALPDLELINIEGTQVSAQMRKRMETAFPKAKIQ